eukprot:COSAG02_NODE_5579_length_4215_cov_4.280369_1_plen_257_part_10
MPGAGADDLALAVQRGRGAALCVTEAATHHHIVGESALMVVLHRIQQALLLWPAVGQRVTHDGVVVARADLPPGNLPRRARVPQRRLAHHVCDQFTLTSWPLHASPLLPCRTAAEGLAITQRGLALRGKRLRQLERADGAHAPDGIERRGGPSRNAGMEQLAVDAGEASAAWGASLTSLLASPALAIMRGAASGLPDGGTEGAAAQATPAGRELPLPLDAVWVDGVKFLTPSILHTSDTPVQYQPPAEVANLYAAEQ